MKKLTVLMLVLSCAFFAAAGAQQETQPAAQKTQEQIAQEQLQAEMQLLGQIDQAQTNASELGRLCEEFVQKFPNSQNLGRVEFLAILAFQQLNNFEKLEQHAQAAIKLLPGNPVPPAILCNAYAEKGKVDEAETTANQAIGYIDAMAKPEAVPQEQWDQQLNPIRCSVYSTLGYVNLIRGSKLDRADGNREKTLQAALGFFEKALASDRLDDISYYRSGLTYGLMNKLDESLACYAKAVAINRGTAKLATGDMQKILDGLKKENKLGDKTIDGLVAKAKADLQL